LLLQSAGVVKLQHLAIVFSSCILGGNGSCRHVWQSVHEPWVELGCVICWGSCSHATDFTIWMVNRVQFDLSLSLLAANMLSLAVENELKLLYVH
jgi:hypothetical protein